MIGGKWRKAEKIVKVVAGRNHGVSLYDTYGGF